MKTMARRGMTGAVACGYLIEWLDLGLTGWSNY
jgi:hypothetical protein